MRFTKKTLLILALTIGLLIPNTLPASAANNIWVCTANLNLRSGPSTSYSILFTMPASTVVWYLGSYTDGFYKVQAWDPNNSKWVQGWANINYITNSTAAENVSGVQKYIYTYNGGWTDSGYRLPVGATIFYKDYYGVCIPTH